MIEVDINKREKKKIEKSLSTLREDINDSSEKGLSSASYEYKDSLSEKIGSRRGTSLLASRFKMRFRNFKSGFNKQAGNKINPWRKRLIKKRVPFGFLAQFTRYLVNGDFSQVSFGSRQSLESGKFDRAFLNSAQKMEEGFKYKVTPKMRRFAALSISRGGIGIAKKTKFIVSKKRPTIKPVFVKGKPKAMAAYRQRFVKEISKNDLSNE